MAARRRTPSKTEPDLTPEQKAVLDGLTPEQLRIYNALVDAGSKIDYLQQIAKQNAQTSTVDSESGLTREQLAEIGRQALFGAQDKQKALGGVGFRRIDPKTGEPIPGSYSGMMIPAETAGGPEREPLYFQGDEAQIRSLTPEELAKLQTDLEKLGYLSKYRLGVVDSETLGAFTKLLGEANIYGSDWRTAIDALQNAPSRSTGGTGLGRRRANPDDLRRVFRRASQTALGYTLDDARLSQMVSAFQQQEGSSSAQSAEGFAETQIEKQNPLDTQAYDFAQFAQRFLGGGGG